MFVRAVGVLLSFASIAAGPADRNGPAEAQPSVALTAHDTIPPGRSCSSLADVSWSDGSKVTSAAEVPPEGVVPEYCEVTVLVPADIHIVVELPMTNWNGRYEALGGGGYDGSTLGLAFAPSALAQAT